MGRLKTAVRMAGAYVAAFIGAGFASGQEVELFFASHGKAALLGILVAWALLTAGSALILERCHDVRAKSYQDLIRAAGERASPWFDAAYSAFTMVGLAVMLAGCAEIVRGEMGVMGGGVLTGAAVVAVICLGQERVLRVNSLLAGLLVISLSVPCLGLLKESGLSALDAAGEADAPRQLSSALSSALLYAGYNLTFSIAVWSSFHRTLRTRWERAASAALGNAVVACLLLIVTLALWAEGSTGPHAMPLRAVTVAWREELVPIWSAVIYLAMFSTALTHAYALAVRAVEQSSLNLPTSALAVTAGALALAGFGFRPLVSRAYPLVGVIGLVGLAVLLRRRQ